MDAKYFGTKYMPDCSNDIFDVLQVNKGYLTQASSKINSNIIFTEKYNVNTSIFNQEYCTESGLLEKNNEEINQFNNLSVSNQNNQMALLNVKEVSCNQQIITKIIKSKNSNIIKKIGRIIIDNRSQYRKGEGNLGVRKMINKLRVRSNRSKKLKNSSDQFNTSHLQALFDADEQTVKFNLQTTQRIFSKVIRKDVLNSSQITNQNKIIYLNSLKCFSIRLMNNKLAVRLQI